MTRLDLTEPGVRAILTYHSIDDSASPISVSPETFRAHVRFLAEGRVRVVRLEELPSVDADQDAVALTFDDGFENFATQALPLLQAHGLPATVFVVSDHVGRTNAWGGVAHPGIPSLRLMDWETLGRAAASGTTIGAHTRRHLDLTSLASDALEDEVGGAVDRISAALGVEPATFAYPYGRYDDRAVESARRCFTHACTTDLRLLSTDDDPMRLPRLDAWYFRAPGQLEQWGSAAFRRRVWLRAGGRRVREMVLAAAGR